MDARTTDAGSPAGGSVARREGRKAWLKVIRESGLPKELAACVEQVVLRSRLWRAERVDVARELVAHFQDGMTAGASAERLVSEFGNVAAAARLIRRAKKRTRPAWWHAQKWVARGCLAIMAIYACMIVWFVARSPDVKRNFSAELNAPVIAADPAGNAWPVYLTLIEQWPELPAALGTLDKQGAWKLSRIRPGDPRFGAMAEYLKSISTELATIRRAAAMPRLGFVVNRDDREAMELQNRRAYRLNSAATPAALA